MLQNQLSDLNLSLVKQESDYAIFLDQSSNKTILFADKWTSQDKKSKVKKSDPNKLADLYFDKTDDCYVVRNGSGNKVALETTNIRINEPTPELKPKDTDVQHNVIAAKVTNVQPTSTEPVKKANPYASNSYSKPRPTTHMDTRQSNYDDYLVKSDYNAPPILQKLPKQTNVFEKDRKEKNKQAAQRFGLNIKKK